MSVLIAVMSPTEGHTARGVVTFEPLEEAKVRVTVRISGLRPNARHAIHIHEFGDLSAPDGASAGDHFNPSDKEHGLPENEARHAGDFGNLQADAEGNASQVTEMTDLSLTGEEGAILGRAVIIHALEDKGTQPGGEAGDRIAQGVIAIANPSSIQSGVASTAPEGAEKSKTDVSTSAATRASSANAATSPNSEETAERVAGQVGRGAEKAARTTVRVVERGADEVGDALKKVGKKLEKIAD